MLYIILIIIAVFVYLIYKGQNATTNSRDKAIEFIQTEITKREDFLLSKIKASHLKDYLQTEKILFDCGRKNFIRLSERFKHDDVKLRQVTKDWLDYMDTVSDIIHESEMLDVTLSNDEADEHRNNQQELFVKIQEIDKRTKGLLGDEYIDPIKSIDAK